MDDDTLRDSLSAAFDSHEQAEAPAVVEAPAEPSADATERAERARDEAGRFAKEQAEEAAAEAAKPRETLHLPDNKGVPGQNQAAPEPKRAPSSWKKEAAAEFDRLPPHVQDEVLRREGDFHKGIEGFKNHAEFGKAFERAIAPYRQTIEQFGVTPDVAIAELLKVDNLLRTAPQMVKRERFMQLAREYQIDLAAEFNPDIAQVQARLYDAEQKLQLFERQRQEESTSSLNSDIERFQQEPGHEHFEAVRGHMGALLSSGMAQDLQDAYDQAVYANPQTRAALLEQQRKEALEQVNAQRRNTASLSVKGSTPAAGASAKTSGRSIREELAAAFDEHA